MTLPQVPGAKPNNRLFILVSALAIVLVLLLTAIGIVFVQKQAGQAQDKPAPTATAKPKPTQTPVVVPTPSFRPLPSFSPIPTAPPSPTYDPDDPNDRTSPLPYFLKDDITDTERSYFSGLQVGDCMPGIDGVELGPEHPKPSVPCSQPHTAQVFGLLDLTHNVTKTGDKSFVNEITRRCDGYMQSLLQEGILADADGQTQTAFQRAMMPVAAPNAEEWDSGLRAAMCIIMPPEEWTGSMLDGTATFIH
jgi:hypothetical protein